MIGRMAGGRSLLLLRHLRRRGNAVIHMKKEEKKEEKRVWESSVQIMGLARVLRLVGNRT
jgi:hypothetical protein